LCPAKHNIQDGHGQALYPVLQLCRTAAAQRNRGCSLCACRAQENVEVKESVAQLCATGIQSYLQLLQSVSLAGSWSRCMHGVRAGAGLAGIPGAFLTTALQRDAQAACWVLVAVVPTVKHSLRKQARNTEQCVLVRPGVRSHHRLWHSVAHVAWQCRIVLPCR
jgi:hypothetical protein